MKTKFNFWKYTLVTIKQITKPNYQGRHISSNKVEYKQYTVLPYTSKLAPVHKRGGGVKTVQVTTPEGLIWGRRDLSFTKV